MSDLFSLLLVGIAIGVVIGYLFASLVFWGRVRGHRKDAIQKSQSVILGTVKEKIAPLLPNFPYQTKDMVFIWKGIDYLIFDGLHQGRCDEIVFLEIKTGSSQLNMNEKSIKSAVEYGKVRYEVLRI
jgi:predicted Holliday junction resolvase-like endonuclease